MKFTWREQHDEIAERLISDATGTEPQGESLTEQRHVDDVDLNVIVQRFGITDGSIPNVNLDPSQFAETDDRLDLREIIDRSRRAQEAFMQLPAKIRKEFDHDPAQLWRFVNEDPEGAVALGLLKETPEPAQESPKGDTK